MQTAVAGHQTECTPALVDIGGSCLLKAADIVAEIAKARCTQGQTASECFGNGGEFRRAVAAPVYGEFLTAHGPGTCKQARLALAVYILNRLKYTLVVQISIIVVHCNGCAAVEIFHIGRNSLAEVRLDGIHAHAAELAHAVAEPAVGVGICEIHDCHTWLPQIALEHAAVGILNEIAVLHTLIEQLGTLCNIGIDPAANAQSLVMQTAEHCLGFGELCGIPLEVCPLKALHPEAVKMEHLQRNITLKHAVNKGINSFLIIISRKGCGKPQTEGVCRWKCGLACQVGVIFQNRLQVFAAEEVVLQLLARNRHGHLGNGVGRYLVGNLVGAVDQHAVALGGDIERNALVALLGAGAAVGIPCFDVLSVLDKGCELFAEAVDALAHIQRKLLTDEGGTRIGRVVEELVIRHAVKAVLGEEFTFLNIGSAAPCAACKTFAVVGKFYIPVKSLADAHAGFTCGHLYKIVALCDHCGVIRRLVKFKFRLVVQCSLMMHNGYLDHIISHCGIADLKCYAPERHATVENRLGCCKYGDRIACVCDLICLCGIVNLIALAVEPQSV